MSLTDVSPATAGQQLGQGEECEALGGEQAGSAARSCGGGWEGAGEKASWSIAGGSHASTASWLSDSSVADAEDPTVRLALALGLNPADLPLLGGPGLRRSSTPAAGAPSCRAAGTCCRCRPVHPRDAAAPAPAAARTLRFALSRPAASPGLESAPAHGSGHHLQSTACLLAKQRSKSGAAQEGQSGVERVRRIDDLLAAMRRRLAAVRAAMAQDRQEAQQQGQHEPALGDALGRQADGSSSEGQDAAAPAQALA